MEVINTIGRRKTSVARVYLSEGKGNITINKKDYKDYFSTDLQTGKVDQAFILTDTLGKYDATINVDGGGFTGQVEAIRLGISRALVKIDEEYKPLLKAENLDVFNRLKKDYRAGVLSHFGEKELTASKRIFTLLSQQGGRSLVGKATQLSEGTFWQETHLQRDDIEHASQ